MRIYVNNTAKDLIITLADADEDVDATGVPVTFTGYEDHYGGPVRFAARTISNKVYSDGTTICTMPWQQGDVTEPGRLYIEVNVEWPGKGLQTIRPIRFVKIRP